MEGSRNRAQKCTPESTKREGLLPYPRIRLLSSSFSCTRPKERRGETRGVMAWMIKGSHLHPSAEQIQSVSCREGRGIALAIKLGTLRTFRGCLIIKETVSHCGHPTSSHYLCAYSLVNGSCPLIILPPVLSFIVQTTSVRLECVQIHVSGVRFRPSKLTNYSDLSRLSPLAYLWIPVKNTV